ncbi:ArsR/SmtB family transcription factor [Leptospira licerasiae]|uniref:Rhodanese-like protein n=2 Tax=Leptospira licerasiae TaxID=447106 RepID=A0ABP2REW5_9LEPT|nr:metalloregulator ArsR/SmtB family transcription factor [Leptospira licerasiae]EIE00090.1 transcriptional regulator, ArsR family domain / rhodanese-like domain multi-domain protein [Leptospira licerasiae serovar Varillal str. VAR 010]EJZ42050.1 rhodanese-like protein [Leptospira licerasiae str. MMD4847]
MKLQKTGREFKNFIYSSLAKYGKAISDPKRIELMDLLVQAEKNVDVLSKETGMSIASTSHHLQILKEARLVSDRRKGRNIFYQIEDAGIQIFDTISSAGNEFNAEIQMEMSYFFNAEQEVEELEYKDFLKRILSKEIILIDVRPENEYDSGHLPGSISVPLKELKSKLDKLPKRKKIFAYCRGKYCVLSEEAVKILRTEGYDAYRIPDGPLEFAHKGVRLTKRKQN